MPLADERWLRTGIPGFDELLGNGLPRGSNYMVSGGAGTGKTLLCLQILYNLAKEGHDCVYLTMEEMPYRLKRHMKNFSWEIEELKEEPGTVFVKVGGAGRLAIKKLEPITISRSVEALLERASGRLKINIGVLLDFIPAGFNPCAIALDSISALETAFTGKFEHYRVYIEQLYRFFEELGATSFLIVESTELPHKFSRSGVEEFLSDGIIGLYNFKDKGRRLRGVEVVKIRGAPHVRETVTFVVGKNGLKIFPDQPISL